MKRFIREWGWVMASFAVSISAITFTAYRRYCPAPPKPDPLIVQLRAQLAERENDILTLEAKLLAKNQTIIEARSWWLTNADNLGIQWARTLSQRRTNVIFGAWRWELAKEFDAH